MKLQTLRFPLAPTAFGTLGTVTGAERVSQGVLLYFGTPRGSRALLPEFGYPELPFSAALVPAWNLDAQQGLLLVDGLRDPQVFSALDSDGRLQVTVRFTTNNKEGMQHEFTLNN